TSSADIPAAAKTSSRDTSGVIAGGPRAPASITNVSVPDDRSMSRTNPISVPLVSRVPMSTTGMAWPSTKQRDNSRSMIMVRALNDFAQRGYHATVLVPRPPEHGGRRHRVGRDRIPTRSGVPFHTPGVCRQRIQFGKRTRFVADAAGHGGDWNADDRR